MAAEIRLEREFTLDVPLDQAWETIADADALAAALPEAQLRAVDGVHTGRVQLGSSRGTSCEATIVAVDRDDDGHVATALIRGRQVNGPGIGSATLRSRVAVQGSTTLVSLGADVRTTGHEPGSGFEAGAQRMFESVVQRLERRARERPAITVPQVAGAPEAAPARPPGSAALPASTRVNANRKALIGGAAAALAGLAVLRRLRRGRRSLS